MQTQTAVYRVGYGGDELIGVYPGAGPHAQLQIAVWCKVELGLVDYRAEEIDDRTADALRRELVRERSLASV